MSQLIRLLDELRGTGAVIARQACLFEGWLASLVFFEQRLLRRFFLAGEPSCLHLEGLVFSPEQYSSEHRSKMALIAIDEILATL